MKGRRPPVAWPLPDTGASSSPSTIRSSQGLRQRRGLIVHYPPAVLVWVASYPRSGNTLTLLTIRDVFGVKELGRIVADDLDLGNVVRQAPDHHVPRPFGACGSSRPGPSGGNS